MAADHLRAEITRQLAPILANAGFKRVQPKHFMSVSGDLVRQIGFQMSQWGGKGFYLHCYVNTLLDPQSTPVAYRVGRRLQREPESGTKWQGATPEDAAAAIESVVRTLNGGHLAWLQSVCTLRDYVYEYFCDPQWSADDFELALVLARDGQTDRPWWSAEKLLRAEPDATDDEFDQERRRRATLLQEAIKSGTVNTLLDSWRQEYIVANKLSAHVE